MVSGWCNTEVLERKLVIFQKMIRAQEARDVFYGKQFGFFLHDNAYYSCWKAN